jgi:hypothetical protein
MWPYSTPASPGPEGLHLELYPNPVVSELYVHVEVDQGATLRVEVNNLLGQLSYQAEFKVYSGAQTLYFDAGMVQQAMSEPGIYSLNIFLDGKFVQARKLVKQ